MRLGEVSLRQSVMGLLEEKGFELGLKGGPEFRHMDMST